MAIPKQFNELEAMSQFVSVLTEVVGADMGKLVNPETGVETSQPAILIGRANDTAPNFPRIVLTYQGDNDGDGALFDTGLVDVPDPDNPSEIITVPYSSTHLTYSITLTCESGSFDTVLKDYSGSVYNNTSQTRLSSGQLLRKVRKSFLLRNIKKAVNERMHSSLQLINTITPIPSIDETEYSDSSTMTVFFTTIDTVLDYNLSWFDSIEGTYEYYRVPEDCPPEDGECEQPLTGQIIVTSNTD